METLMFCIWFRRVGARPGSAAYAISVPGIAQRRRRAISTEHRVPGACRQIAAYPMSVPDIA
eukprot:1231754-Rhodomonas_salina.2